MPKIYVEFRIGEEKARMHLPPGVGRRLGEGSVVRVDVEPGTDLFRRIGELDQEFQSRGRAFFSSFRIVRRYSRKELEQAEAFQWIIHSRPHTAGELFSDLYDYSVGCSVCRVGRRQVDELRLDVRKLPKKDITITLGGEIVVSERFVQLVRDEKLTGDFDFRPVQHYMPIRRALPFPPRWQLLLPPPTVPVLSPPTQFGITPFDFDPDGVYRCPNGHVAGLNLLSEVTVARRMWSGKDLSVTLEHVGNPWPADPSDPSSYGLFVPEPLMLISPRFLRLLEQNRLTGTRVEVAYIA